MNWRVWLCGVVALGLVLGVTNAGLSQDKGTPPKDKAPAAPEKKAPTTQAAGEDPMAKIMEMMEKMSAPGENHALLKGLVGSWNVVVKTWMDPAGTPEETKGTAEHKLVLGGRFLMEEYSGTFIGKPFTGIGIMGYDNAKKAYVSMWIDTMSTGIPTETGAYDAASKTWTFNGGYDDPMTGAHVKTRSTLKVLTPDKLVSEMYNVAPDGKEIKSMEFTYTRK
jgi:hypothetical protein